MLFRSEGKKQISQEIIERATKIWPLSPRDFHLIEDDTIDGIKIMRFQDSAKTARIMERGGVPYYEYRDTAVSSVGLFRPEWIEELCIVDDNDPNNKSVHWNKGHFMHQFTYFIGDVNYYYLGADGERKVAVMNTGDSVYGTPFRPHTFATRKCAKKKWIDISTNIWKSIIRRYTTRTFSFRKRISYPILVRFFKQKQSIW